MKFKSPRKQGAQILEKVAKTAANPTYAEIPTSKLYLKVQNIYINPLKIPTTMLETSY